MSERRRGGTVAEKLEGRSAASGDEVPKRAAAKQRGGESVVNARSSVGELFLAARSSELQTSEAGRSEASESEGVSSEAPTSGAVASEAVAAKSVRVLIVDDHAMILSGIRSILTVAPGIEVVGTVDNGLEAIAMASRLVPDVMLVDIGMPGLNGMEVTRKVHAADPEIAIVALSMHSDERYVTGMLDAGARGYLLKTCDGDELIRAINAVMRRNIYITSELTSVLIKRAHGAQRGGAHGGASDGAGDGVPPADSLTPREREVLQLIAEGKTSKEIAERLGTALKTVESHRTNLMRKLDLHSIAALTKYAIREGVTRAGD